MHLIHGTAESSSNTNGPSTRSTGSIRAIFIVLLGIEAWKPCENRDLGTLVRHGKSAAAADNIVEVHHGCEQRFGMG